MSCANRITYICSLNIRRIIITWTDNSDRYIVSITGFIILWLHGGIARSAGVLVQCVDNSKQLDANDYKHKSVLAISKNYSTYYIKLISQN